MNGIERLKLMCEETKNPSLDKIVAYLETRTDMYDKFLNEEKTTDQMLQFITNKAREQSVNNCAIVDDKVAYIWALLYFLSSNEALGLNKNSKIKVEKEKIITTKKEPEKLVKEVDMEQISMFKEG